MLAGFRFQKAACPLRSWLGLLGGRLNPVLEGRPCSQGLQLEEGCWLLTATHLEVVHVCICRLAVCSFNSRHWRSRPQPQRPP